MVQPHQINHRPQQPHNAWRLAVASACCCGHGHEDMRHQTADCKAPHIWQFIKLHSLEWHAYHLLLLQVSMLIAINKSCQIKTSRRITADYNVHCIGSQLAGTC